MTTTTTSTSTISSNLYYTKAGLIVPMLAGSLSFFSSLLIVGFILLSRSNTAYHRILFGLSFFDMLTSLACALTTLPMPKDVIYPFSGPSYGTIETCQAQGIAYFLGTGLTFHMTIALNIYYVCTLRYSMTEKTFSRRIEPFLYVLLLAGTIYSLKVTLFNGNLFNPNPLDPFCSLGIYPLGCASSSTSSSTSNSNSNMEDDNYSEYECRGEQEDLEYFQKKILAPSMISSVSIFTVCMLLILHTFHKREKDLEKQKQKQKQKLLFECQFQQLETKGDGDCDGNGNSNSNSDGSGDGDGGHRRSEEFPGLRQAIETKRIINRQVIMYVAAFSVTYTFFFVAAIRDVAKLYWVQLLRMMTQPSQGTFTALIFFYHKISLIRRCDKNKSFYEAFKLLITDPRRTKEADAILRISVVYEAAHKGKMHPRYVLDCSPDDSSDEGAGAGADTDTPRKSLRKETANLQNCSISNIAPQSSLVSEASLGLNSFTFRYSSGGCELGSQTNDEPIKSSPLGGVLALEDSLVVRKHQPSGTLSTRKLSLDDVVVDSSPSYHQNPSVDSLPSALEVDSGKTFDQRLLGEGSV